MLVFKGVERAQFWPILITLTANDFRTMWDTEMVWVVCCLCLGLFLLTSGVGHRKKGAKSAKTDPSSFIGPETTPFSQRNGILCLWFVSHLLVLQHSNLLDSVGVHPTFLSSETGRVALFLVQKTRFCSAGWLGHRLTRDLPGWHVPLHGHGVGMLGTFYGTQEASLKWWSIEGELWVSGAKFARGWDTTGIKTD